MASLLSSAASTSLLQKLPFPPKPTSPNYPSNLPRTPTPPRCNALPLSQEILNTTLHLDDSMALFPFLQSGFSQLNQIAEEFPELQRWEVLTIVGLGCVYLTARPGVLMGAIDTYLLAPLQVGLDSLAGRRSLKRTDFVVGDRLGEGSFGIVYSGAIVPKNGSVEDERVRKKGRRVEIDGRFKQKVILKKVKVGIQGAEECGDFEEWFNYRLSRAAPETCAEFLGSFIADKTNSQFTKGGKWLVWKFELNSPDLFDMYSAGITLLQMAIPTLRSAAGLKNFNSEIKTVGYDLKKWRELTRLKPDFRILDLDSGRGWDLATKLISERGFLRRGRLSAAAALRHPYFLLGGDQAAAVLSKLSLSKR
eukprot:TRINITY_DN2844_c1_g1_i2.p1 TRINITY_DN2844_c1_g1~~TRINITY_DN2844_c1_g1_i2.p1  ORF type:complete len:364 (-),score=77.81 TRINITY_DN2844_c1_g1_i2:651-1742(-)